MVTTTSATVRPDEQVAAPPLARPFWRRARMWLALLAVVVIGAVLLGTLGSGPGRDLDPTSHAAGGSRALAHVLDGYGTSVTRTTFLTDAVAGSGTVLVTAPDDYSDAQLRRLAAAPGRLVLVDPGVRATRAVLPDASPDPTRDAHDSPGCALPGALAAGNVDLPDDAFVYDLGAAGGTRCYGGAVAISAAGGGADAARGDVVLFGAGDLLRNDHLARRGVAALDVNLLGVDRTVPDLTWLLPGTDAGGTGSASVWDLFPDGVYRAFLWVVLVGVVVVLWRARRLGPVVREPLPVVVRAAELIEGHGRLYERAGARDRAAATLRAATLGRLTARLSLPPGSSPEQVTAAVSALLRRPPGDVHTRLAGPAPSDDAALIRLATDLDELERAVADPKETA